VPARQVRARYDADTITVYQAYPSPIAEAAVRAGTFVAPFKVERMTWIKPSFLWMMYRCGWAAKAGQERVLAIDISRSGFEWALDHASLSHYRSGVHASQAAWAAEQAASPVRVQWDPERSLQLAALPHRSIQVGLSGEAVHRYVDEWIVRLRDVTDEVRRIHELIRAGQLAEAGAALPVERPYPLPPTIVTRLGASDTTDAGHPTA
jgi:hypothetical protein